MQVRGIVLKERCVTISRPDRPPVIVEPFLAVINAHFIHPGLAVRMDNRNDQRLALMRSVDVTSIGKSLFLVVFIFFYNELGAGMQCGKVGYAGKIMQFN